jgi:prophage regulatory protein
MSDERTRRALRPAQAAEKLGVSLPTLWRYARSNPSFPRPSKLSERVTVFDEYELDEFVASRKVAAAWALPTRSLDKSVEPAPCREKFKATLAAQLAIRGGYVLIEHGDGTFTIHRWNLQKHCKTLEEVAAFAQQVGAIWATS